MPNSHSKFDYLMRNKMRIAKISIVALVLSSTSAFGITMFNNQKTGYLLCVNKQTKQVIFPGTQTCPKNFQMLVLGAQGVAGANGLNGVDGKNGEVGAKGDAGVPGPQGAMGPVGPQGAMGPVGPQGAMGPSGLTNRFTVVDATGKFIGYPLMGNTASDDTSTVLGINYLVTSLWIYAPALNDILLINLSGSFPLQWNFYFDSNDCTGSGYVINEVLNDTAIAYAKYPAKFSPTGDTKWYKADFSTDLIEYHGVRSFGSMGGAGYCTVLRNSDGTVPKIFDLSGGSGTGLVRYDEVANPLGSFTIVGPLRFVVG